MIQLCQKMMLLNLLITRYLVASIFIANHISINYCYEQQSYSIPFQYVGKPAKVL